MFSMYKKNQTHKYKNSIIIIKKKNRKVNKLNHQQSIASNTVRNLSSSIHRKSETINSGIFFLPKRGIFF